jgi:PII-like signaling protein
MTDARPGTPLPHTARRLMIIVDEDACIGRTPVYTEIVQRAHRAGLAGASVFRGIEGFGSSRVIHTSRILSLAENLPAMIVIIDAADRIDAFLLQLSDLGVRGVIAIDDVELARPGHLPQAARP